MYYLHYDKKVRFSCIINNVKQRNMNNSDLALLKHQLWGLNACINAVG
jgi:hypothetical protein